MCGQEEEARGLQWFKSAADHYQKEEIQLDKSMPDTSSGSFVRWLSKMAGSELSDPDGQNRDLARARLHSYAQEFKLLDEVYTCAQFLFFRKE